MRRTQPRGSPGVIMAGTRENILKKAASIVSASVRCSQPRPRPVIARGDAQQWRPRSAAETPSHPAAPAALWLRAPHKLHGHSLRRAVRHTPGACPPTSPRCARGADHTPQRAQHASRPAAPAAPLASCSPQAACGRSLRRAVRRTPGACPSLSSALVVVTALHSVLSPLAPSSASGTPMASCSSQAAWPQPAPCCAAHTRACLPASVLVGVSERVRNGSTAARQHGTLTARSFAVAACPHQHAFLAAHQPARPIARHTLCRTPLETHAQGPRALAHLERPATSSTCTKCSTRCTRGHIAL